MPARILHVAFDQSLLETRGLMLKSMGYSVTSVIGKQGVTAMDLTALSQFHVAVIGFSSTHANRAAILHWLKSNVPALPVVVLKFHDYEKFPAADCVTLSEDPAMWLAAVAERVPPR